MYLRTQSPCSPAYYEHKISLRTARLLEVLRKRGLYSGDDSRIALVAELSDLHDIGKIAVPQEILRKPGKLTAEERACVRKHTLWGQEIVRRAGRYAKDQEVVRLAADICLLHHEHIDGSGYPFGLKGEEIPLEIQAVSLVDAFDALCSDRCYKRAVPRGEALKLICAGECGCFSPELYAALLEAEAEQEKPWNAGFM